MAQVDSTDLAILFRLRDRSLTLIKLSISEDCLKLQNNLSLSGTWEILESVPMRLVLLLAFQNLE